MTSPKDPSRGWDFSWQPGDGLRGCPGTFASLATKGLESLESSGQAPDYLEEFHGCHGPFTGACQALSLA